MRLRYRRPLAVGAATLLASVAAVAVARPAMADDLCWNLFPTITITNAGSYNGTSGDDVVVIKSPSGMTYYNPVGGRDHICTLGSGTITVWSAGSGHWISGGPGPDRIYGSEGPDDIGGNGGDDLIKGNGGNDLLWGYAGNDYIRGNNGDDQVHGGVGDDCLLGGRGYDDIIGDDGHDVILTGHENRYTSTQCAPEDWDTSSAATAFMNSMYSDGAEVHAGNGNDRVWGSNGNDSVSAGAGNDVVRTFNGDDFLAGDWGSDTLNGGYGNDDLVEWYIDNAVDQLYGGPGTDSFSAKSEDVCYSGWGPGGILSCTASPPATG